MSGSRGVIVTPQDAASVVLARPRDEVYLTLRPRHLRFAGGYYVFPGGVVEEGDYSPSLARHWPRDLAEPGGAFWIAAIREVFEEVGLLLAYDDEGRALWQQGNPHASRVAEARQRLLGGQARLADLFTAYGWKPAFDRMRYIGRWITPPGSPQRFDTRFFLADVSGAADLSPHRDEVEHGLWLPVAEALAEARRGRLPMMTPTHSTLDQLYLHGTLEAAMEFFADPGRQRLRVDEDSRPPHRLDLALRSVGVERVEVPSPTLAPWFATNVYIVASAGEALIIDAGAGGAEGIDKVRAALARLGNPRVRGLILTHGHPDHSLGAGELQRLFEVPVWAHPAERSRIESSAAPARVDYPLLGGEKVQVGRLWLEVLATPGHTEGHLALYAPAYGIAFLGDTAVAEGSVWVGPPDGDLTAYLRSLERLMGLKARLGAPGHGPVFDEVEDHLRRLIERRLTREEEILELLRSGARTFDEIVEHLYAGRVPAQAMEAARRTALGHLVKLQAENRIRPPAPGDPRYRIAE